MTTQIKTADQFITYKPDPNTPYSDIKEKNLCYMSLQDKQHKAREKTAMEWATIDYRDDDDKWAAYDPIIDEFDNVPTCGIKISKSVSRYTTDNKLLQIEDPRGFEVQISVANLVELMEHVTIDKGVFQTPLQWGRANGNVYLYAPEQLSQVSTDTSKHKLTDLEPGTKYEARLQTHLYLGEKCFEIEVKTVAIPVEETNKADLSQYNHIGCLYSKKATATFPIEELSNHVVSTDTIVTKKVPMSLTKYFVDELSFKKSSTAVIKETGVDIEPEIDKWIESVRNGTQIIQEKDEFKKIVGFIREGLPGHFPTNEDLLSYYQVKAYSEHKQLYYVPVETAVDGFYYMFIYDIKNIY